MILFDRCSLNIESSLFEDLISVNLVYREQLIRDHLLVRHLRLSNPSMLSGLATSGPFSQLCPPHAAQPKAMTPCQPPAKQTFNSTSSTMDKTFLLIPHLLNATIHDYHQQQFSLNSLKSPRRNETYSNDALSFICG